MDRKLKIWQNTIKTTEYLREKYKDSHSNPFWRCRNSYKLHLSHTPVAFRRKEQLWFRVSELQLVTRKSWINKNADVLVNAECEYICMYNYGFEYSLVTFKSKEDFLYFMMTQ